MRSRSARRAAIGVSALLTAVVLLVPAGSAQARPRPSFFGVVPSPGLALTGQDLDTMRAAKVGIVRFPLYQEDVEPSPGTFNFSASDQFIGNLASRGIPTLPDLLVSQSNPPPPTSGSAAQNWQAFVRAVAARYGPGGTYWQTNTGPDEPTGTLQVYNEPNLSKYFPSSSPVTDYAQLLALTRSAVNGVNPNIKLLLAGMPALRSKFVHYPGYKFLNQLYGVAGVKANFDIVAVHPYAENLDQLREAMTRFRKVMRRHGDKRSQIWVTEFGYGSAPFNHHLNFGLKGQARMLRKSYKLFLERRRRWHMRGVVWYDWRDPPVKNPDCSFCSTAGLLRSDFSPKPAFNAFKHFTGAGS